jgi:O-antigen/teichoic acid export membrane protein
MSKVGDIAQVSAKGSFNALLGLVVSTVISSVGIIFAGRLLGPELYGLYSVAMAAPILIGVFRDWGVNSAVIRFTAQYRAEKRLDELRSVMLSGLIFEVVLGSVLAVVSFFISDYLAVSVFNRPVLSPLIRVVSFSILADGLINASTAVFVGIEKMAQNSTMIICQSIIKTVLIITLVTVGFGISGAAIGYVVSSFLAATLGLLLVYLIYKKLPKPVSLKLELKEYTKEMFTYGLPISITTILTSFLTQYYVFLLPIHYVTDNAVIGNYGIAQNFAVLVGFAAVPITTMMFPAFSKLDYKKDKAALKSVFRFSIKYASLLVIPVMALVVCLSEPAVSTLFGSTYQAAPLFLALLAMNYLYTAFGVLSINNLINSQGHTKTCLMLMLLTTAIGLPMGTVLILQFGVLGLIATTLTQGLPGLFISIYWVKKSYEVTLDWGSSARIILSSALAGVLTYLFVSNLSFSSWLRLLLGVLFFVLIVLPSLLFTKSITKEDLANLRLITGKLGFLSRVIDKIFAVIERFILFFKL